MKRLLVICGLVLMSVSSTPSAGAGGSLLGTPNVTVSPAPVVLDSPFTISGCGYRSGEHLWLGTVIGGSYADADATGCFSTVWVWDSTHFAPPQLFQVLVYDASTGQKIKSKVLASAWFTVVAPA